MTAERNSIRSLLSIIFIDQTYITITFPLLALIFFDPRSRLFAADTDFAVRSMWYGLCVGLPNVINLFFAPFLSTLSDEIGRKKILLLEIVGALLFTLMLGLGVYSGTLMLIFFGFIVKGAFVRTNPTALAMIGDTVAKEKKILYMGYLQFAISVGAAIGPIIGGYLANRFLFTEFNFSLPFFIAAGLATLNIFLTLCMLRETLKKRTARLSLKHRFRAIKDVLCDKNVLLISLILLLIQLSWSTYYQFMPPILKTIYQFNAKQLGWFIGMIAFWLALATSLGISLLHRFFDIRRLLLVAIYLLLLGFILTVCVISHVIAEEYFIWLSAMPIASGDVIAYSCLTALYSNVVTKGNQGKVMGISFIIVALAWAATGFLGGLLMSVSPSLPLIIAPLTLIIAVLLVHARVGEKLALAYQ